MDDGAKMSMAAGGRKDAGGLSVASASTYNEDSRYLKQNRRKAGAKIHVGIVLYLDVLEYKINDARHQVVAGQHAGETQLCP